VWLFISTDCPICNNYQPELERLRARYTPLGIEFIGVYAEVPVSATEVGEHVRQFAITYPTIIDDDRAIRNRFGVRCVPEVVVPAGGRDATINPLAFLYRGRIDDQYPERGSRRPSATTHDLNDALRDITQGRAPAARVTTPVGCVLEP
jgi:thiol-disulfide isomerase/thioredoxin